MTQVRDIPPYTQTQANKYETDFHAWAFEQSQLIAQKRWHELDAINLIEEIESLGKQQREQLENRLGILLGHLLKWNVQPEFSSKSWKSIIREQRRAVQKLIAKNPSLKPYLVEAISEGYAAGLDLVVRETPLDYTDLPKECPFTVEQIFDSTFPDGIFPEEIEA